MTCTAAIIQARMGSTRLPGKILMDLAGKTVLARVLERCKAIAGVDVVCCAVPTSSDNDGVVVEAKRCGVEVFRGSETDVLDRYYQAGLELKAGVVLRVTSDCPLIDPAVCAEVLQLRSRENAAYACNNMPPSWPHGLDCEAIAFDWLERAAREASDAHDREHVTPYLRHHPDATRANLAGPGGVAAQQRWTLDYPQDLAFLKELFALLPPSPVPLGYRDVLAIIDANPWLSGINDSHVGESREMVADTSDRAARPMATGDS